VPGLLDRLGGWLRGGASRKAVGNTETLPLVLTHHIGASASSTDWVSMVRRIVAELHDRLGLGGLTPETDYPGALRLALANGLHKAAAVRPIVLVIDGLDRLDDRQQAPDLAWLPDDLPNGLRLIVSTSGGRPLDEVRRRGWTTLEVQPLGDAERRAILAGVLACHGKRLDPQNTRRIVTAPQTASPLFLGTLAEELRIFGSFEKLNERISDCLVATTVRALFDDVLSRYERDYGMELTRDAFSLIASARQGLTESELLDLLGSPESRLPSARWSPLFLAARSWLVGRSGRLGFAHEVPRSAVMDRYLGDPSSRDKAHRRLADYFAPRNGTASRRQVEEWPWQLAAVRDWPALAAALTVPEVLPGAWSSGPFEVKSFWALIATEATIEPADAYRDVIEAPAGFSDAYVRTVALLLNDLGKATAAGPLVDHLVTRARTASDPLALQAALSLRAQAMKQRGDLAGAAATLFEQIAVSRQADDGPALAAALDGLGLIYRDLRDPARALEAFFEEEALCHSNGDLAGLAACLGNQGIVWFDEGDAERALGFFQRQEKLCGRLGDLSGLHRCLGNQAAVFRKRGHFDRALNLHAEEETICRRLGDLAGLATSLGNQAVVRMELAELDAAWDLLDRKEQMCDKLGDTSGLIKAKFLKAYLIGNRMGLADDARPLAEEALRLARSAGLERQATETAALLRTLERHGPGSPG